MVNFLIASGLTAVIMAGLYVVLRVVSRLIQAVSPPAAFQVGAGNSG